MKQDKLSPADSWNTISLERITPAQAGIDPGHIIGFLDQLRAEHVHLHSFMMVKGQNVFAEGEYYPCRKADPHMLCSLSKSFTSTAVGFAVQEKLLSVEDYLSDYFLDEQEFYRQIDDSIRRIRIRHLLTMNTGHAEGMDHVMKDMSVEWSRAFMLSHGQKEPGSWFCYSSLDTYMLSWLIQKVTGETVLTYLRPRLFEPLGFQHDIWWEQSPENVDSGGVGLYLPVEDIAKFGIFVRDKGTFNGKQLLNAAWIEDAVTPWSDTSNTWSGENCFGYGYQFWMNHIPGTFRGDGAFGQYCAVFPEQDMIFATTGGELAMQKIIDAFWKHIFPYTGEPLLKGIDPAVQSELDQRLRSLELETFYQEKKIPEERIALPDFVQGKVYRVGYNILQITRLAFSEDGTGKGLYITLQNGNNQDRFHLSAQNWEEGCLHVDGAYTQKDKWSFRTGLFEHFYAKGCTWPDEQGRQVLYFDMIYPETAYQDTWEICFGQKELSVHIKRNAGFDDIDFSVSAKPV